ncbi:50S ribosomal protein L29 [Carboxylicivirga linearis]|uniref:Large ribosomal subunit protein uL29 n=1 Tax=Carboxylicivirga linearis TaxID=1628157 RepID=A0ABS5JS22_9BACT|nr:50S ribosomal protein L29 [Carboxylicivirga linearis]MBS2097196.1 50S ribosomal protein L29 [Carboxylicivirga linearis]
MKVQEIKELSVSEIQERIETEKAALQQLELNHATSPLDNPMKIRHTRRNIARLTTVLGQKQLTEK